MDDWRNVAEKELRRRIANFFVCLEFAAETSKDADLLYAKYKEEFCIDDKGAEELRMVAYKES